jgi:pimeloyl-ACP methyl ester carboxylesterase
MRSSPALHRSLASETPMLGNLPCRRNNYPNQTSPDGTPDGAADVHGEDLASLVRALGYSKARIVAHSSGAHAALFFAAAHPDMVVSLAPLGLARFHRQ